MVRVLLTIALLLNLQAFANFLIKGDYYFSTDCIKVGKESTNKIYYFDELSEREQQWLLNHKDANPIVRNGKVYLNVTQMQDDLGNHGYGLFYYPENARVYDAKFKKYSYIHTYEEVGVKRINRTHSINIGAGQGLPATIHNFRSIFSIW